MTGIWQNKDLINIFHLIIWFWLELNINFYVLGVGWSLPNGNWMVALNWQFDPNWSSNPSIISKSNPIQWISKYCLAHFKCLPSKEKLYVKPNVSVFSLSVFNASHGLCATFLQLFFSKLYIYSVAVVVVYIIDLRQCTGIIVVYIIHTHRRCNSNGSPSQCYWLSMVGLMQKH